MKNHLKLLMVALTCLGTTSLSAQVSLHLPHGVFPDSNKNCQVAGTLSSEVGQLYAKAVMFSPAYSVTVVPVGPGGQINFPNLPYYGPGYPYYIYVNKYNNTTNLSPSLPTGWSYSCSAGNNSSVNTEMVFYLQPTNNTFTNAGLGLYCNGNIVFTKFVYNDVSRICNYNTGVGTNLGGTLYAKAQRIGQLNGQNILRVVPVGFAGGAFFDTLPPGQYKIWVDSNHNPIPTNPIIAKDWLFTCESGYNSTTTNYGFLNPLNVPMGSQLNFVVQGIGIYNPGANQSGSANVGVNRIHGGTSCDHWNVFVWPIYAKLIPEGAIFASNVYFFPLSHSHPNLDTIKNVKPGEYRMVYCIEGDSSYSSITETFNFPNWVCQREWYDLWDINSGSNNYIGKWGMVYNSSSSLARSSQFVSPAIEGKEDSVQLLANPVDGVANLQISLRASARLSITVTNMLGQQVLHKELSLDKGSFLEALDVSNLSAGSYILSVRGTTLNQTIRFIKN